MTPARQESTPAWRTLRLVFAFLALVSTPWTVLGAAADPPSSATSLDFEADVVEGPLVKPDIYCPTGSTLTRESLIRIQRSDLREALLRSAADL